MTIMQKFVLLFVVIFMAVAAGVFFFYRTTIKQTESNVTVDIAGRQRMLSQKYVKERINDVFISVVNKQSEASFTSSEGGKTDANYLKTKKVFDTTLDALINGGEAPVDLDMSGFVRLHPANVPEIKGKLEDVKQLWARTQTLFDRFAETEINSNDYIEAYNSADAVTKAMNDSVCLIKKHTQKKADAVIWWTLGGFLGVTSLVIGLSCAFFATPLVNLLKRISGELTNSSEQFKAASAEISSASQSLAEASSKEASMVSENRDNVSRTKEIIEDCSRSLVKSIGIIDEMNNAMEEIKSSTMKISEITKVVEDIANKTDLLAVNAAIEAANAGERGKGFAVVAEEVRNLSQRSSAAAKETKDLINDSVNKMITGANLAKECKKSMDGISHSITEQLERINKINDATAQIETIAQQNASCAEETAAASEELLAQAENLMSQAHTLSLQINRANQELHNYRDFEQSAGKKPRKTPLHISRKKDANSIIPMDDELLPNVNDKFADF